MLQGRSKPLPQPPVCHVGKRISACVEVHKPFMEFVEMYQFHIDRGTKATWYDVVVSLKLVSHGETLTYPFEITFRPLLL